MARGEARRWSNERVGLRSFGVQMACWVGVDGGLLHVLLGVPGTLDVVVSSVNLHQAPAVALATVAVSPSVLTVPGLEGRASSGLSGDDGTDKVVVDVLLGTGAASLGLVLSELGPIVGSKSLRAGLATSVAVAVLNRN